MIAELAVVGLVLLGGATFVHAAGLRGWPVIPLGLVSGLAILIGIGTVQAVIGLPTSPYLTLVLAVGLPVVWWVRQRARGNGATIHVPSVLATTVGLTGLVALLRAANLLNWHTDTFRYLLTSYLLAGGAYDAVTINLVDKRLMAMPVMHAPARLFGESYLRSITPLLALATLAILYWVCVRGLRRSLGDRGAAIVGAVAVVLLLTINRFVFNAFYLNAHLLVAALVLVIAGAWWLLERDQGFPAHGAVALIAVCIPALVVARAEGALLAALLLLPGACRPQLPRLVRAMPLFVLGGFVLLWHGFSATVHVGEAGRVPFSVLGMLGLAVATLVFAGIVAAGLHPTLLPPLPWLAESALWAAVALLAWRRPDVLVDSANATFDNVVRNEGSWGPSLVALTVLALYVLVASRASDRLALRFPVTTFVPLVILLAYFREGAYRVGHGDSLNRMLIHIVPLTVLLIASGTAATWARPSRAQRTRDATATASGVR